MGPLLLYICEQPRHACSKASRNKKSHTVSNRVRLTLDSSRDQVRLATLKTNASECDITLELYHIYKMRSKLLPRLQPKIIYMYDTARFKFEGKSCAVMHPHAIRLISLAFSSVGTHKFICSKYTHG